MDTMKNVRLTWSYDEEIVIEPGYKILHERASPRAIWPTSGASTERLSPRSKSVRSTAARWAKVTQARSTVIDTGHGIR